MDTQLFSIEKSLRYYVLGVVAVAGAAGIRTVIDLAGAELHAPFLLYALPPIIAGWRGGFWPSLATTFVAALAILMPSPFLSAGDAQIVTPASFVLFLIQGLFISVLCGGKKAATEAAQEIRLDLENRVRLRTEAQQHAYNALEDEYGEKKRLLEELNEFAARLERSNLELQDFASVASHDLQEPLRKIQAFGDRLRTHCGDALDERGADYLERMLNSANRMTVLINDLLSFSRISTQAQPFVQVDLNETLEHVLSDLEARTEELGAVVVVGQLPTLAADPTQMRQLFQNLISNGLKFRRPDIRPEITITSRPHAVDDGDREWTEVRIKDNGIGFDEKYLDRIFNIFQRLHGRSAYEGTGIGLAVCRKIVERHGGRLTAESREGEGATFIVILPLTQTETGHRDESARDSHHNPVG